MPTLLLQPLDQERLIHGAKTSLACLIGFVVARLLNFPIDQWLIITILVVMCAQLNVGSMIQKSYSRFLGTLTGSAIAAFTLFFFPHNVTVNAITIALCGAFFSYIATSDSPFSDAGTLGAVTVSTILIGQNPSLLTALERCIEISVGIFIAALVSQFVLPIQAKSHLRRTQAKTILQLRNYYRAALMTEQTSENIQHYLYLDEEIVKSLSSQRSLAKQSRRERFGITFSPETFSRLLRCEKSLFRSMICMQYALDKISHETKLIVLSETSFKNFNVGVVKALEQLAPCFTNQHEEHVVTIPSLLSTKQSLLQIREHASENDLVYLDGLLFGSELLVNQLIEMTLIIDKNK